MTVAEIVAIGTELLLGEQQDSNSRYLAQQLRLLGIDVYHMNIVGDNLKRISGVVTHALSRADIVLTCGGLGPTVDDPTRSAIAHAVKKDLVYVPDLWEMIKIRFERSGRLLSENNRQQAFIPRDAIPVENPVGTAPSFIVDLDGHVIVSLPGVPFEMQYLFEHNIKPYLKNRFNLESMIKIRVLHVAGIGESKIDEIIGDLESNPNPTVGLAAHAGQVDIRVTVKATDEENADALIYECEKTIRDRLGDAIYGADDETLGSLVKKKLESKKYQLFLIEYNLHGELSSAFMKSGIPLKNIERYDQPISIHDLQKHVNNVSVNNESVVFATSLNLETNRQKMCFVLRTPQQTIYDERSFGDTNTRVIPWLLNFSLDFIRRNI
jgi:nicotinamide-nucleotide amidase